MAEFVVGQVAGYGLAGVMEEVLMVRLIRRLDLAGAHFIIRGCDAQMLAAQLKVQLAESNLKEARESSRRRDEREEA